MLYSRDLQVDTHIYIYIYVSKFVYVYLYFYMSVYVQRESYLLEPSHDTLLQL